MVAVVLVHRWMKNDLVDQIGWHDDECSYMMINDAKFYVKAESTEIRNVEQHLNNIKILSS